MAHGVEDGSDFVEEGPQASALTRVILVSSREVVCRLAQPASVVI